MTTTRTARPVRLSRAQARRTALAAQGFRDPRHTVPTMRTAERTLRRTVVLQIDSVNVFQRAHYMPLFSRMGRYDTTLLARATEKHPRRLVEYWAHVAAFMPVDLWPVMQHRMERFWLHGHEWYTLRDHERLVDSLLAEVRERGASTARDLDAGLPRVKEHWGWNWSETKRVLEYLFVSGRLAVAGRTSAFERLYDLPERVLPGAVLARPTPSLAEANLELVRRASRSHGIASEACLRDYFRMHTEEVKPAVRTLLDAGELVAASVEGWDRPLYLHRDATTPRKVRARALLSPFDPVVWERSRTRALFDFAYRIEIYVPEAKRLHGYYVLPFLLGDRLVGRVDLKADRKAGVLQVRSAFAEPEAPEETAAELAAELAEAAAWVGLDRVEVAPRGDLAGALYAEVRALSRG